MRVGRRLKIPFKRELTEEDFRWSMSRVLIAGPPNSGKTTSGYTFPRPLHIISVPGEVGVNSIPRAPDIFPYIWAEDPATRVSSTSAILEVKQLTVEILTGKYGPCETIFIDGAHRLYELYVDAATGGDYLKGAVKDKGWLPVGQAKVAFREFLKMVKSAPVPVVVFTVWEGAELDRAPKDMYDLSGPKHILPGFVGQMAKEAMGEFSLILSSHRDISPVNGKMTFYWQLKPQGEVHGAQIKMDPKRLEKLPVKVEQDWQALYKLLTE